MNMKKVLLLGAGLVTRPLVRYLLEQPEIELIIASRTVKKADDLLEGHAKGKAVALDVKSEENKLEELVKSTDISISLLPWIYHLKVAKLCLKHSKHLVTTSYVSPAMKELDEEAKSKGLLFLNEIGLDPGIDHMSAMKIINDIQNRGGKVASFESICGGLPAPDDNDNPLGYKFSWSPRGVLLAGRNTAHFLKNGEEVFVENKNLFKTMWHKEAETLGKLEVYPNRDSMIYKELYGLKDSKTIFRGTFRNHGWCETLYNVVNLGWLDDTERAELLGMNLRAVTAKVCNLSDDDNLKANLTKKLNLKDDSIVIKNFDWLSLFDKNIYVRPELPTYIDVLAGRMLELMSYNKGERDMIVLQHDFIAEYPNKKERIISLMIDYGIKNGDSAMARTVSLPAAIATKLICDGKFDGISGVHIPILPEIYEPVLKELAELKIVMKDSVSIL